MIFKTLVRRTVVGTMALALAGCTTTQAEFNKKPEAVSKAALCRTFMETKDQAFYQDLLGELSRRQIGPLECDQMVQQQNQAAAALVAVAVVGAAVAVCANNNCGNAYYPSNTYQGNCQYDWQYDSLGRRCGHRSAWSRPGGF